jgi:hypothetical protein
VLSAGTGLREPTSRRAETVAWARGNAAFARARESARDGCGVVPGRETTPHPSILRLVLNAAASAAASPTLL